MEYAIENHQFESAGLLCKISGKSRREQRKILSDINGKNALLFMSLMDEIIHMQELPRRCAPDVLDQ